MKNLKQVDAGKLVNFKMYKAKKQWLFASALVLAIIGGGMLSNSSVQADEVSPSQQTALIGDHGSYTQKVYKDHISTENGNQTMDSNSGTMNQEIKQKQTNTQNAYENTKNEADVKDATKVQTSQKQVVEVGGTRKQVNNLKSAKPLADARLAIDGTAVDGLKTDDKGQYQGELRVDYTGYNSDPNEWKQADVVFLIPEELRKLFASDNFRQYISATGSVDVDDEPFSDWKYDSSNLVISADGSLVICHLPSDIPYGTKYVKTTLHIDLGAAVNATQIKIGRSHDRYTFNSVMVDDATQSIDWNSLGKANGKGGTQTNQLMPTVVDNPQVNVPQPGDRVVTGTANPQNTINVYNADNVLIGTAVVQDDGTFTVEIKPEYNLYEGEAIYVIQVDQAGNESNSTEVIVTKQTQQDPTINEIHAGEHVVSGTGVSGSDIDVYNDLGVLIGHGTVGSDGKYSIEISPAYNLYEGETISVIQTDPQGQKSKPISTVVVA